MEELKDFDGNYTGLPAPSFPNSPSSLQRSKTEDLKTFASFRVPQREATIPNTQLKKSESIGSFGNLKDINTQRAGLVDTTAPFESVKEVVTKFGGVLDWKAHRRLALEKSRLIQAELEKIGEDIPKYKQQSELAEDAKTQALDELQNTKRLLEELKHNLEKTETEEAQAKQDSELAQLRAQEIEQGISADASVAAKAQIEVSRARHQAAINDLKSVKEQLIALEHDYERVVVERDLAILKANEAMSAAGEIERRVEDLTLELITTKETLESAHASHLEAEEQRIEMASGRNQDTVNFENQLKRAESEIQHLTEQISFVKDLKSKLDTANITLHNLKSKLAQDKEPVGETFSSVNKELEEVNSNIEKAKEEVKCLRVAASSLKLELDQETETVTALRERKALTDVTVSSLEAELSRLEPELELVRTRKREAMEKSEELPRLIEEATHHAEEVKSVASTARAELEKVKEDAKKTKESVTSAEAKLHAALKEIEAAKASEKLALTSIEAMRNSESVTTSGRETVTLSVQEYYALSKNAHECEVKANERVISAIEQIKEAKKSKELRLVNLSEALREIEESKVALANALEKAKESSEVKPFVQNEPNKQVSSPLTGLGSDTEACESDVSPEPKPRKKRLFFPRFVMFLARKKVQSMK